MRERRREGNLGRGPESDRHAPATPSPASTPESLVGASVTLDGKPAVVIGGCSDFATIATLDGSARFEWPWPSVVGIIVAGGNFRS